MCGLFGALLDIPQECEEGVVVARHVLGGGDVDSRTAKPWHRRGTQLKGGIAWQEACGRMTAPDTMEGSRSLKRWKGESGIVASKRRWQNGK